MSIQTDRDVLETCAKTLELMCTEGSAIYTRCDIARSNIIDQCVNRYKEAIDDWRNLIAGEENPDEDEIYNVVISLKKIAILYSCHNLNHWNLFDSLFQDIDDCQSGQMDPDKTLTNEALTYCIESCFFSINWGLQYLENNAETSTIAAQVEILKDNLHKFIAACNVLIRNGPSDSVKEAVSFHKHIKKYTININIDVQFFILF